jgi:hypothetical protein
VVATTKSPTLQVRYVKKKFITPSSISIKREHVMVLLLFLGLICERLTPGFINLFYVVEGETV